MTDRKAPLIQPSVYGHLVDRYLFNFRVSADAIQSHLPIEWLRPRLVNGHGVVTFCLLRLRGVTLWPLPTFTGVDSTSCAYRCAVTDLSGLEPEDSVYILGRSTNVPLISILGTKLFSGEMKLVRIKRERDVGCEEIKVKYVDGRDLFSARVAPAPEEKGASELFDSQADFVSFIKGGLSSYTPSVKQGRYSRVDLVEDSNHYVPVDATIQYNWLDKVWKGAELRFDSAFHASGGLYRLKYLGTAYARSLEPAIQNTAG